MIFAVTVRLSPRFNTARVLCVWRLCLVEFSLLGCAWLCFSFFSHLSGVWLCFIFLVALPGFGCVWSVRLCFLSLLAVPVFSCALCVVVFNVFSFVASV